MKPIPDIISTKALENNNSTQNIGSCSMLGMKERNIGIGISLLEWYGVWLNNIRGRKNDRKTKRFLPAHIAISLDTDTTLIAC